MGKTPKATTAPAAKVPGSHMVSAAHPVSSQSAEMSKFEFGLIVASNAFQRWVVHCMSAAGLKDKMPLDVLVLHHVSHRARDKRLSDICFIMNIEDTPLRRFAYLAVSGGIDLLPALGCRASDLRAWLSLRKPRLCP